MRTVQLILGFEGTHYEGWQSQRKNKTIQEVFERILSKILKGSVTVFGCSRTDSGVHARQFVAHFKTPAALPDEKIKDALNYYLPKDVTVFKARTAHESFHARFDAKSKLYRYRIWNDRTRPLFERNYTYWHPNPLNILAMRRAAKHLVGRHDFSAFQAQSGDGRNPVKTLKKVQLRCKKPLIEIDVEGTGFLRHMVRIIAGTLIEVGRGRMNPDAVKEILSSKDRKKAGSTAKPQGLILWKVSYKEN